MFSYRKWRRSRIESRAFPESWQAILDQGFPYFRRLPPADQNELRRHIQVFIAEKYFEGCGGLEMTDEIRVIIAAQACLLLLHRPTDYYPGLRSILVYPSAYIASGKAPGPGGVVTEFQGARAGESWHQPGVNSWRGGGPVVLSWRDVKAGAADIHDGKNVVLHEFAHQLDGESGAVEGAPSLESGYRTWARVLGGEYRSLIDDLANHRPTVLGAYAAQSPAEFFAVVTEAFFEKSVELKARHPEMYRLLSEFYRQDPAMLRTAPPR
jgi:Mlc titration factor MtfA (ptsG expression regulator)